MVEIVLNATSTPYNLINVTNSDNILEFVQNVNNMVDGYLMLGMLLAGFIIMFVTIRSNTEPKEALAATSFIMAIISILFFSLEFIRTSWLTIILIAFGLIFVATMLKQD